MYYNQTDVVYEYSKEKSLLLKEGRGISFEEVVVAIENAGLLDIVLHPNTVKYAHQKMYVVEINNYAYLVPFVEKQNGVFLKTIFPCRKTTKKYLNSGMKVGIHEKK
ncbi:MAG: hypothetical protein A3E82_08025 [Gammaproteobacteria bacterium RIFCSPHIGHO2_12_FULL_38_11]|nr:MAG: hypothetical protein A3E82_08025 [Gammaproteobacteria bacterium RIFCSPHIGHO2_12_FULL_38_11]